MPNITAAGTYTKDTPGFSMLSKTPKARVFSFNNVTSLGSSCTLQCENNEGVDYVITNGTITAAEEITVNFNANIKLVVAGSPNFNFSMYQD